MTTLSGRLRRSADSKTYYFPFRMPDQQAGFVYVQSPAAREMELHAAIRNGTIPDYATVIACGRGEPDERLRFSMERYWGHIREQMAA